MMRILHLSADYPDPLVRDKTHAIANLLKLAPQQEHRVYSLNRSDWRAPVASQIFADPISDNNRALRYPAPPKGILHQHFLHRLADWIATDCDQSGFRPEAIHAHKLTIEGVAGHALAQRFGIPLILSAQGNTDLKLVRARPDLRPIFRRIWHDASIAFPFAPWTRDRLDTLLGQRTSPTFVLPCPGPADDILAPTHAPPVIRTAFHLRDHANKNAERLIRAIGMVASRMPQVVLEIIGGGDDKAKALLQRLADRHAPGHVRFRGKVAHGDWQGLMNTCAAFALVSHRESFGMVFSEALLAGAPCLIPAGRAIDGYLPEGEVTISAPPRSTQAIADGLFRLVRDQTQFKARLRACQTEGKLNFLRRDAIAQIYGQALAAIPDATASRPETPNSNMPLASTTILIPA